MDLAKAVLIVVAIASMVLVGERWSYNFDATYNLLSWQSLAGGEGFTYRYDGKDLHFDPTISTGPELYAPTFVLWKVLGATTYDAATWTLVACYAALFAFFAWGLYRVRWRGLLALAVLLFLLVSNRELLAADQGFLLAPLGEPVAVVSTAIGFFCLSRQWYVVAALVLGLALDVKPNIVVGIAPALLVFYWRSRVRRGDPTAASGASSEGKTRWWAPDRVVSLAWVFAWVLLLVLPHVIYTQVLPRLSLSETSYTDWTVARRYRVHHMADRSLGQLKAFRVTSREAGLESALREHGRTTLEKIDRLRGFYSNSYLALLAVLFSVIVLMVSAREHFGFYLLVVGAFNLTWWLFFTGDAWYRYFLVTDLLWLVAVAAVLPSLLARPMRAAPLAAALTLVAMTAIELSPGAMAARVEENHKSRLQWDRTAEAVRAIDGSRIYTYGWFQCPQVMFLADKRFSDYTSKTWQERCTDASEPCYFLECVENALIREETENATRGRPVVARHGANVLYLLRAERGAAQQGP